MIEAQQNFAKKNVLCGYHLLGARSAVVRFSGILNADVPRSVADDMKAQGRGSKSSGSHK